MANATGLLGRRTPIRTSLDAAATLVMIIAGAAVLWRTVAQRPPRSHPHAVELSASRIPLIGAHLIGSSKTAHAVIEFSDFECPFCGSFARDVFPAIESRYIQSGRIQFGFRELPLPFHSFAESAAVSAECADQQGAFWSMHTLLFSKPTDLSRRAILAKSQTIHLNQAAFLNCLGDPPTLRKVRTDFKLARGIGVSMTPTFVLGTVDPGGGDLQIATVVAGTGTIGDFTHIIDAFLSPHSERH